MNITVGSTNPHKLEAVQQACRRLNLYMTVCGVEAISGQNPQPFGLDETYWGARNRAIQALAHNPKDIAIGIENGIFEIETEEDKIKLYDKAFVVIITEKKDFIVTQSDKIEVPEEFVKLARFEGFAHRTVGSIVARMQGGDPNDPHSTLSKGTISRTTLLKDAVFNALSLLPKELLTPSR